MTDYTELKRVAEAVKKAYADLCEHGGDQLAEAWNSAELAYDDAANPDVVLALIDELDQARNGMKYACGMRLKKEIDRLRDENEALRKDAERWRFFSVLANDLQAFPHSWGQMTPEKMDYMCDEAMAAAMSKESQP